MVGIVFVKNVEIQKQNNQKGEIFMATKICQKCSKAMDENTQFYTYKNGEKTEMCKKCLKFILCG